MCVSLRYVRRGLSIVGQSSAYIDGCFLKSTTKGQLLAAVGRDANNQIFPIAWAVVNVEETESWVWFIQLLKKDFNLKNGDGFTLVSDRQKVRFWLMWNSFFIFSDFIYVTFFIFKGSAPRVTKG